MFEAKVRNFLQKYNLNNKDSNLLVTFSGGEDSLSLMFLMLKLSKEFEFRVSAVHVNHQWRGQESLEDELFVRSFCHDRDIEIFVERLDENLPKTELIAREKRYEIFNKAAERFGSTAILTAHHQSDQVETILYRIIKGTGQSGLAGIPEACYQKIGPPIYRPFLDCSKEEIRQYAENNNLKAREDSSNNDQTYLRNRIRHTLLPELITYNEKVDAALLRLSKISSQNEQIIEYFLEEIYRKVYDKNNQIKIAEYKALPEFIKPRVLIRLFVHHQIDYNYDLVERVSGYISQTKLTRTGKKYSLIKNLFLHITQKRAKIVSPSAVRVVKSSANVIIPGITELNELNIRLETSIFKSNKKKKVIFPPDYAEKALVDLSQINNELTFRTRQPGDIINPLGMTGHMKLKKYLTNKQITPEVKDTIPLVAVGNEVLWLAGVGISDKIKVKDVPTHVFQIVRGKKSD